MPQWTEAQRAAIGARNDDVLISAAAGSGKTAVLIEHVLKLLREGAEVDRLLVITFTRAAAAELRERLSAALEAESDTNAHMRKQSLKLGRACISTLHVFCLRVIREHFETSLADPTAKIGDPAVLEKLKSRALDEAMEAMCAAEEQGPRNLTAGYEDAQIAEMTLSLYSFLMAQSDPFGWLNRQLADVTERTLRPFLLLLRKECLLRLEGAMQLCDLCRKALDTPGAPQKYIPVPDADEQVLLALSKEARDGVLRDGEIAFMRLPTGKAKEGEDPAAADRFRALRDEMKSLAREARSQLPADDGKTLADVRFTMPALRSLAALAQDFGERYAAYKEEKNLLDYNDLEHMALRALSDENTRKSVSGAFDAVFVDEYQDVSGIQEAIVKRVHENNRLFMVGDVKQSIYRFRLADPTLFLQKYEDFQEGDFSRRRILLTDNFRSRGNILAAVNAVFERAMRKNATEIDYDEGARLRAGIPTQNDPPVQLHIISQPDDDGEEGELRKGWLYEARLAAELIRNLIGQKTRGRDGKERALHYRDIVILLRNASGRAEHIARALLDAGIPVYSDADARYFDLPEITEILSLLRVLDNPYQDVPLLSALRCPCFSFSSERLARIRLTDPTGGLPFWQVFYALREKDADVTAALTRLDRWRFLSRHLPVEALLWKLLFETGLYARAGALEDGEARQANLRLLCERAGTDGALEGLHAFLEQADTARGTDDTRTAKTLGENEDLVRILTLHKSKGLEFPVVIMMEMARSFRMPSDSELLRMDAEAGLALKLVDPELRLTYATVAGKALAAKRGREIRSEEARLLYVGMTRARDQLILLASPRYLGGCRARWSLPAGDYAAGCAESMLDWIGQAIGSEALSGGDRLCEVRGSLFDIRWHDAKDFSEKPSAPFVFAEPPAGAPGPEICERFAEIKRKRRPAKQSVTALLREKAFADEKDEVETPEQKRRAPSDMPPPLPAFLTEKRLTAADRGAAAHKALGAMPLSALRGLSGEALRQRIEEALDGLAARGILSPREREAVRGEDLCAFYESDLGRMALCADEVRREWSFNLRVGNAIVQGVPDLCCQKDGRWTLVDYKTDRCEPEELLSRYSDQLKWYSRALREITGREVEAAWLYSLRYARALRVELP